MGPKISLSVLAVVFAVDAATVSATTQDPPPELLVAAAGGDVAVVRDLLAEGVDPDARGPAEQTALMLAAGGGHSDVVKLLLERGANPNAWDADEDTALGAYAAANGHTDIVRLLIEAGASPLAANREGMDPLMFAALYGHLEAMSLIEAEMPPLGAAQSLGHLADALEGVGRDVDAGRIRARAAAITGEAERALEVFTSRGGEPPLYVLAGVDGRCIGLGFPAHVQCVRMDGCTYTRSARIQTTWVGGSSDEEDIVERFVRDARRQGADAVIDLEVEMTMDLGRYRMSRIEADGVSFANERCKEMARGG